MQLTRSIPVLLLVALTACSDGASKPAAPTTTAIQTEWEQRCPGYSSVAVVYLGEGTARDATFTAAMPDGTSQGDFTPPLMNKGGSKGLRFCAEAGEFLYISLQNGTENGSITCKIEVDGEVVAENTSTGDYAIADCQA